MFPYKPFNFCNKALDHLLIPIFLTLFSSKTQGGISCACLFIISVIHRINPLGSIIWTEEHASIYANDMSLFRHKGNYIGCPSVPPRRDCRVILPESMNVTVSRCFDLRARRKVRVTATQKLRFPFFSVSPWTACSLRRPGPERILASTRWLPWSRCPCSAKRGHAIPYHAVNTSLSSFPLPYDG